MTDDSLLTKCPHCQTLFRIQQEHLAAAGGEVRCGVCYKVFDAENEGLTYSQGEGSPADQTFAESRDENSEQLNGEEVIDTSPAPESDPQQALAEADIDQPLNEDAPSVDDLDRLDVGHSSVSDIIASNNAAHNKRPMLKWPALSLLAGVALFAQWLFFNFDKNAQQPQWHNLYATACDTLGCELPQYNKVTTIKTERLAIKTHPEYNNVLIVDMIISNSSSNAQPMPMLDMTFFSINGQPLAKRLFQPREYLSKQFRQLSSMPSKTPVHLSFAILDPGYKAVNYSVNFAPAS